MPRARDRLIELDSLRGIAALIVVLYHTLQLPRGSDSAAFRLLDALPTHPLFSGRMAVIFFFVLSGAVLTRSLTAKPGGPPGVSMALFVCRRVVRLCLPVAAVVALSMALYWCLWDGSWAAPELYGGWSVVPTLAGFTRQTLLFGVDGDFNFDPPLWSLVHELRLSLIVPLVVAVPAFRGTNGSLTLMFVALITYGISITGQTTPDDLVRLGSTAMESFRATAYFALPFLTGAAMSLGQWHRWQPSGEQRRIALMAALALLCTDSDKAVIIASVLLILLARHNSLYRSFLRIPVLLWLGRVSFSLYIVNMPVRLAVQHGLHAVLSEASRDLLTIALSLVAAWAVHYLAERPAQRLSRWIRLPRVAHPIEAIPSS